METKHTPTPWEIDGGTDQKGNLFIWRKQPIGTIENHAIAKIFGDKIEVKANAAFIVTAVNNHGALIEALKKMCDLFDQDHRDSEKWVQYQNAKAALAKVKGE
jgi:creatinine amidohydrolase/Fe(II)-dependent formamide hydrolase-like protein